VPPSFCPQSISTRTSCTITTSPTSSEKREIRDTSATRICRVEPNECLVKS
jgi:hypothetical protein